MHTADNHIGIEFRNQPVLRDRLKQERLEALRRIVDEASVRDCHFLVVAGDLFDSVNVPAKLIAEVSGILAAFTGDVLVLPGNHDFYEGRDSRLWGEFLQRVTAPNIHLLSEHAPVVFHAEGREVVLYPCHCPSKHAEKHVAGWVSEVPKTPGALHIGIAHGNVEGLGRDDEGNYFNMTWATSVPRVSPVGCSDIFTHPLPSPAMSEVISSSCRGRTRLSMSSGRPRGMHGTSRSTKPLHFASSGTVPAVSCSKGWRGNCIQNRISSPSDKPSISLRRLSRYWTSDFGADSRRRIYRGLADSSKS